MEPLTDTDPEAALVQMELLRRASPERRLRLALSLRVDRRYLEEGARELAVGDLLERALSEAARA